MSGISDSNAPKPPAWFGAAVPFLIILLTAGLYWYITDKDSGDDSQIESDGKIKLQGKLEPGQTYYIFASEIEVFPTNLENEPWDRGEKGPDIRYRIIWKGNAVFESPTKNNSLIADWSGLSLELNWKDIMGKSISTEEAIKAGRIRFDKDEKIEIVAEDVDIAADDKAGRYEIEMSELSIGKNLLKLEKSASNAIRRITLRVLPVGSNIRDLANIMK
jgi:hypothetical protein